MCVFSRRRFGFVRFSNNRDADRAIERLNGFNLYGARIEVSYAKFQGRTSYWRKVKPRTETFVVNESKGKEKMHITSLSTGNRMDNCWNGKHKLFSSEPGESSKDCISHIKRIHGHVEEESLWRLSKSLIGLMATDCSTENVMDRLHNWGLGDLEIRSLGSRRFLIVIKDDDLLKTLEGQQWSLLKEVEYWVESFKIPERSTWIEVAGIPLHCWNSITFKRIAAAWGTLEALGENGNQILGCEKVSMLISTTQQEEIEEILEVVVGDDVFIVRVYEVRFLRIVTGKMEAQSGKEDVKGSGSEVEESSTDFSEAGDRRKKSISQVDSVIGDGEFINEACTGIHSQEKENGKKTDY
ncbi:hypothetical protein V6N13_063995 [Hibiscus sabdariffa]